MVVLIGVTEDLIGNEVEFIFDGSYHALDGFFNGLDAWPELGGALLGNTVDGVEPHEDFFLVLFTLHKRECDSNYEREQRKCMVV